MKYTVKMPGEELIVEAERVEFVPSDGGGAFLMRSSAAVVAAFPAAAIVRITADEAVKEVSESRRGLGVS
jgi:hypothetical protein